MKKQFNFNFKYLCLTSTALNQRCLSDRFRKKCIVLSTALIAITHECVATPPIALTWNVGTNDQTVWDGTNNVTIPSGQALKKTGLGTAIITKSQTNIASGSTVDVSAGTLQINDTQSLGGAGLVMEDNSIFSIGANVTIANPITVGKSSSTGTSTITGLALNNAGEATGPFSPTFSGTFTQGGTSSSLIVGQTGDTGTFTFSSDMSAMPVKLAYGTTCFTNTPATAINLSGGTLKYSGNGFSASTLTLTNSTYSTLDVNGADVTLNHLVGSTGTLSIRDSANLGASTKKVTLGNATYGAFTGVVNLYDGVTIQDYSMVDPVTTTDILLTYDDTTEIDLSDYLYTFPGVVNDNYYNRIASNGTVTNPGVFKYTPSGTVNGAHTVTYLLQDQRFFTWPNESTNSYTYSRNPTINIRVAPPSDLNGGDITLTEADFTNFSNLSSFPVTGGAASTFTNASTSTASTLTVNLTASNKTLSATLTDSGGATEKLNLNVTGDKTLTIPTSGNTYTGTTNIASGSTLIGDISTSSGATVDGTYDINGVNRTVVVAASGGSGTIKNTGGGAQTLTLSAALNGEFSGTLDNTLKNILITGTSPLTLSGSSSGLSAPVIVNNDSSLILGSADAAGTGSFTFGAGSTFQAKGITVLTNDIIFGILS